MFDFFKRILFLADESYATKFNPCQYAPDLCNVTQLSEQRKSPPLSQECMYCLRMENSYSFFKTQLKCSCLCALPLISPDQLFPLLARIALCTDLNCCIYDVILLLLVAVFFTGLRFSRPGMIDMELNARELLEYLAWAWICGTTATTKMHDIVSTSGILFDLSWDPRQRFTT